MARYKVRNPTVDGLLYLSLDSVRLPKWTLTIWKRSGGFFEKPVEDLIGSCAPKYESIPNSHPMLHVPAHASQPKKFDPNGNYLEHIHICSDTLMKRTMFPVFLHGLTQLKLLMQEEVQPILAWAAEIQNGEDDASDTET